ncbi:hypothetical protein [Maricaulis sp. CAU 1757]
MQHELELDAENQWIIVRFHGLIEEGDPVELMRRAVEMPGWTPHCDRIVVYENDSELHTLDVESFGRMRSALSEFIKEHYGDTPSRSAQVCNDRMKQILLDFWVGLAAMGYPAQMARFDTVKEAQAWLLAQRRIDDRVPPTA